MTEPTDAEIRELAATGNGVYQDDETAIWEITDPSLLKLVHAALAKWGQPAQAAESVGRDADRIVKWSDRIQRAHPKSEPEFWPDALRVKYMADEIRDLRAARAPADSVTAPAGGVDDDVDAIALARYKVVPAHESMFHRFAVVAGDGKQQLYLGRETECQNMARKFAGAFLDGAFYQSQLAPTPPAQTADSVQEDAARYRWLRKQDWFDSTLCVLRDPKTVLTRGPQLGADCPSGTRLDAAIDAERTK